MLALRRALILEVDGNVAFRCGGFHRVLRRVGKIVATDRNGEVTTLATIPAGSDAASADQPPSMVFNGITALPDGTLYATGETSRMLYRLTR